MSTTNPIEEKLHHGHESCFREAVRLRAQVEQLERERDEVQRDFEMAETVWQQRSDGLTNIATGREISWKVAERERDEAKRLLEWYATAEYIAENFHNLYEVLASKHGWVTRLETQVAWDDLPANNKALMLEVAMEIGARARAFLAKETLS